MDSPELVDPDSGIEPDGISGTVRIYRKRIYCDRE